jgi:serine/threonine protein kinase
MTAHDPAIHLQPGRKLGSRYRVESLIGQGSEGMVYSVIDITTGIRRAAKVFRPHADRRGRLSTRHAQKLNRLRYCDIVLQYLHSETVRVRGETHTALVSELCEGVPLQTFIEKQPGKRLSTFMALCMFQALVEGLDEVHHAGEYHADVHAENIMVQPRGVGFEIKLIDFYEWGKATKAKQQQDILDAVKTFYDMLGGRRVYGRLPPEVKYICAGLQTRYILKRFPTMTDLSVYLSTFEWSSMA